MNKLKNAVSLAYRFLAFSGERAKGFAEKWGWWFGVILLTLVTLLAVSLKIQSYTLITITGVISVLLVLAIHYAGNGLINLTKAGAEMTGKFKKPLEETAEEAKKLFRPLLTVAMITSFLVLIVNVWGFESLDLRSIQIIGMIFLTLSVVGVYRQTKKPWAGRVVLAFTILSAIIWYAKEGEDPVAYQLNSWISLVSDTSEKLAMATSKTALYQKNGDGISKDNSRILLTGEIVLASKKTLKVKGERFTQITIADNGSYANGKSYYVQKSVLNKKVEAYPNEVEPKCVIAKGKAKNGKIFYVSFLTGEPVELSLVSLGEMYSFRGAKKAELYRAPENTPDADSLVEAPIGVDLYNLTQTVMTLQASAGKTITITTRKPSAYEKAASENWYKDQLAGQF